MSTGLVTWRHSLRTRIAIAVSLVALAVTALVGAVIDYQVALDGRERLRAQALDRINAAASGYAVDGRLRFDASVSPDSVPPEMLPIATGTVKTYYVGQAMFAARRISDEVVISLALSDRSLRDQRASLRRTLVLSGAGGALMAGLLGWLVATGLSRRLRQAAIAANSVGAGDLSAKIAMPGRDEVSALSRTVDQMSAALAARIEQERAFSADVAHELRTPITALVSASELLPDSPEGDLVRRQTTRVSRLVMDLLEISKLESGQAEVELASHDLGPLLRRIATDRGLEGIDLDVDAAGTVLVEPRRLERIVSNLIANVHSHGGGHAYLRAVGNVLVVEDDGPGFPDDVLKDGPQRFRSLGHSAGTGLGMTIAVRQAEVMGAQLRLSNRPEGGARAELTLPVT